MSKPISSGFPFEAKYKEVHGQQMHYIEEGEGDPVLFLHGNPTSNYLFGALPDGSQPEAGSAVALRDSDDGKPADVHEVVSEYFLWLQQTPTPKLFFYAHPGGIIREKQAAWIRQNFPNLKAVDIGPGIHYIQEDNPHFIGEELAKWYPSLSLLGTPY